MNRRPSPRTVLTDIAARLFRRRKPGDHASGDQLPDRPGTDDQFAAWLAQPAPFAHPITRRNP